MYVPIKSKSLHFRSPCKTAVIGAFVPAAHFPAVAGGGVLVGAAAVAAKAHGPPAGPPYPALHVHARGDVLRAGECEFAGQSTHTSSTTAGAPGSSSSRRPVLTHGPSAGPVKPALQVHALCDVLPNGECEF
jgi:hypothetical protein